MTGFSTWNIAAGQWFFRYRDAVFPLIFTVSPLILLRPRVIFGSPALDRLLVASGVVIAVGMCMVSGAPAAYLIVIPLFAFLYQAIMAAEETDLHHTFGADYVAYCSRVPRLLPSIKGLRQTLAGTESHWRRAIRMDLGTITGLLVGFICWPIWRTYFLEGFTAAKAKAPVALGLVLAVLVLYGLLVYLKKRRLFFYLPPNLPPNMPGGLR